MSQSIYTSASLFPSVQRSLNLHDWLGCVYRGTMKVIIRALEYYAYCADDPCLHRH